MVFIIVMAMVGVTSSVLLYRDVKNRQKINDINTKLNTYLYEQRRQAEKTRTARAAGNIGTTRSNTPSDDTA